MSFDIHRRFYSREELEDRFPNTVALSDDIKHLFLEGQVELLNQLPERGLAVVGTRYPQARSLHHLRSVMEKWAERGPDRSPIILSGFARGVDRAAHEAAIEFGLPTLAILGSGLDFPYPAHHRELKKAILESPAGGLLVSEVDWNEKAYPSQFLARNRLIARWSKATWVVEASIRSGAMNTARWAREADRDCYTIPTFPGDSSLAGNETLLDLYQAAPVWGAHSFGQTWIEYATLGRTPAEARSDIRLGSPSKTRPREQNPSLEGLSAHARELFEVICVREHASGGSDCASLMERSLARGWAPPEFYQALDELFTERKIEELPQGLLVKSRSSDHDQNSLRTAQRSGNTA